MKDNRAYCLCLEEAKKAPGVGGNGYRLAACVYDKKMPYSVAQNSLKTHPLMLKYSDYPYLHAEVHACIKAGLDTCSGKDIMVLRIKKNGEVGNSKPCPSCEKFLKYVGINNVFYFNDKGKQECLKLS